MLSQLYNSAENALPSKQLDGIIKANLANSGNTSARFRSPHHLQVLKPTPRNSSRLPQIITTQNSCNISYTEEMFNQNVLKSRYEKKEIKKKELLSKSTMQCLCGDPRTG